MIQRLWLARAWVIGLGLLLAVALPAAADDPQAAEDTRPAETHQGQEQPAAAEEPVLKSQAPAKGGNSLAAAAAGIKLTQPASDGTLVISNANLQKSGGSGAVRSRLF